MPHPSTVGERADEVVPLDRETGTRSSGWPHRLARLGRSGAGRPAPVLLGVCAFLLGLPSVGSRQLWLDELATLDYASRPLPELWALSHDREAVLAPYYLLMHGWLAVFGASEAALRLPSLIAMAGAVGVTAAIGRRWFGDGVGFLAGLLMAVTPSVSRYAFEARPYALSVFLAVLATLALIRAAERPSWPRWLAYAAALALTGLSHLVALSILAAHLVLVGGHWLRGRDPRQLRWLAAVVAALAPVVPVVRLGAAQSAQVAWIPPATVERLLTEVPGVTGSPRGGLVVVTLAILGAVPLDRRRMTLAVWAFVPPVLLYAAAPRIELLHNRYLLFTLPALALLAAAGLAGFLSVLAGSTARRLQAVGSVGAIVALFLALGMTAHLDSRRSSLPGEPDIRGAAAVVSARRHADDALVLHGRFPTRWHQAMNYYLADHVDLPVVSATQPSDVEAAGIASSPSRRVWLLNTEGQASPWDGMSTGVADDIKARYHVTMTVRLSGATVSLLERTVATG